MSINGVNGYSAYGYQAAAASRSSAASTAAESYEGLAAAATEKYTSLEARDENGRIIAKPGVDNMAALSQSLAEKMKAALAKAGLPDNPAINLSMENGRVKVTGKRGDLAQIEELVNSDPDLKMDVEKLAAVTESMYSFVKDGHLTFQREYRMTGGSASTIAKYGHLFSNGPKAPRDTVISYGGGAVNVACDGENVSPDYFRDNPGWLEGGSSASTDGLAEMTQSAMIGALALRQRIELQNRAAS